MINEKERFEFTVNANGQVDIVDWVESEEKNAICIYNDLGVLPFSSAKAVCDLLNELSEENEQLKSILFDVVERLEVEIDSNKDALYGITLVVDSAMYFRIKKIIQ